MENPESYTEEPRLKAEGSEEPLKDFKLEQRAVVTQWDFWAELPLSQVTNKFGEPRLETDHLGQSDKAGYEREVYVMEKEERGQVWDKEENQYDLDTD